MTVRRLMPAFVVPLAIIATGLASAPWLRAFPSATISVALFGAAVLSVLLPVIVIAFAGRNPVISAAVDVLGLILFELFVALKDPAGFRQLVDGFSHGPAQLLSYALPLVSPPSLLVAPVALCWLSGAVAGEALSRTRTTLLPYAAWLVSFGLSYAATVRAAPAGDATITIEIALAGGLLLTMALLRATQTWLAQERSAEDSQTDSVLPLRSVAAGAVVALIATAAVAGAVGTPAFGGHEASAQRIPHVDQSAPLTPVAFISSIRTTAGQPSHPVFQVTLDQAAPAYFGIGSVDFYDGDSWSFNRVFRPSGGVVPAGLDPTLNVGQQKVTQHYRVQAGPLTDVPWMPTLDRVARVTGTAISVDQESDMVVPTSPLDSGTSYAIDSSVSRSTLGQLGAGSIPATSAPPIDTQLPAALRSTLTKVVTAFADETGVTSSIALPFLQAVAKDLQTNYGLSGPASGSASATPSASPSPTGSESAVVSTGTSFAETLAAILGGTRTATPEQYATMFALIARDLGVPARLVTGFRIGSSSDAAASAGQYEVTTAEAATWVELPVQGQGWVVADPTPSRIGNSQTQSVGAAPSPTPTASPSQRALITNNAGGHAVAKKSTTNVRRPSSGSLWPWLWTGIGAVVALSVLLVVVLLLRKTRRRSRRRRLGDPRDQLLGAWNESIDLLAESGLTALGTATNHEIAAAARDRFGETSYAATRRLGEAANRASYSSTAVLSAPDAVAAWDDVSELRRAVNDHLRPGERIRAALRFHRSRPVRLKRGPASWADREPTRRGRRR